MNDSPFVTRVAHYADDQLVKMLSRPRCGRPGRLAMEVAAEANRRDLDYPGAAWYNAWLASTNLKEYVR